ncbi:MAG: hypothetical protein KFW07_00895, partial [Mycoplasmataceae bacterium]|nr:hypothetical protein [Mycoplasmataceae bacterium]
MSKVTSKISNILFEKGDISPMMSNSTLAVGITSALATSVKVGFDKQVAIINVVELMKPLSNKYDFIDKGDLEYGIGEQTMRMGFKNSEASSITLDNWLPEGPLSGLKQYQSTSTGAIQRKVTNDYSEIQMREYVRNSDTFASLIELESSAGAKTKSREHRESCRYLFGIDNNYLPADFKTELSSIKNLINQNRIEVKTTTDYKSVVNYLHQFADDYYNNYNTIYNAGNDPTKSTGNIFINGVDTGVECLANSAVKEETVLILSTKFVNKLRQELGNTYNPEYWIKFKERFGLVIEDTFTDESIMYVVDKNTVASMSIFSEYTNTYYPDKSAFHTINKWKDYYKVLPFGNLVSFKFTLSSSKLGEKVKEVKGVKAEEVKGVKAEEVKGVKAEEVKGVKAEEVK